MTTDNLPAGMATMMNTVRTTLKAQGLQVTVSGSARAVIVTAKSSDATGEVTISKAHAALRTTDVAPSHIVRQAPNVLKITGPKVRKPKA